MIYNVLGRTGLSVSQFALGGHEYLDNGRSRGFNEDMAKAVTAGYIVPGFGGPKRVALLQAALDAGINVFDVTIDAEKEALGRNLTTLSLPFPVYVQTRPEGMCYGYDPGNRTMLDYGALSREVERSLVLLRRERIDLFNIGLLKGSIDETPDFMERLRDNLDRLRRTGKIGFAVADSFSGQRLYMAEMASGAFDAINLDLSLGERAGLDAVIPRARKTGLGVVGREVFFKGELFDIGDRLGIERDSLARLALGWVLEQRPDMIIVGVDNATQLKANIETLDRLDRSVDRGLLERLLADEQFQTYERSRVEAFYERS